MIKVIDNTAWHGNLWDEENPRVALVKYSSNGISGLDKQAFIKRASEETSEELLKKVAQMEVKPGEELIHLIAMGTTEAYGPNRNGDGFSKQACIKYHPTFVKHARFYRNHKNKDPEKSYGIVKASAYNPVMSRIELIVALNGNEKAAKANGGLVADKEMEKLASGDDIAVSMACSVPFDVCSCCGNKATSREEYCKGTDEGGKCEAGGLTSNICKFASVNGKIKQLYADNTQPDFFDISNVFIPADRIAYSSGLLKRAAYNQKYCKSASQTLYGKIGPQPIEFDPEMPYALTVLQDTIMDYRSLMEKTASSVGWQDAAPLTNLQVPNSYLPGATYKVLADMSVCLPASQFIQLTQNCSFEKAASLGRIIAPLSNSALLTMDSSDLKRNPYAPSAGAPDSLYGWACHQSLTPVRSEDWVKQAAYNSLENGFINSLSSSDLAKASQDNWIKQAAYEYALYKVAFLQSQPEEDVETMAELLTARDYVPCLN